MESNNFYEGADLNYHPMLIINFCLLHCSICVWELNITIGGILPSV